MVLRSAARLGLDAIVGEARKFGLGAPTGIEMGRELTGLVPTRAWFEHADPGPFRAGHALNAAVGQGVARVTPIQLAVAYAALANGGTVRTPQIVVSDAPAPARPVDVPAADLARVRAALRTRASELGGLQAGVAGTVGVSDSRELFLVPMADIEAEDGPPDDEPPAHPIRTPGTNGWFAGFAPADAPEVAIVVLVQGRLFRRTAPRPPSRTTRCAPTSPARKEARDDPRVAKPSARRRRHRRRRARCRWPRDGALGGARLPGQSALWPRQLAWLIVGSAAALLVARADLRRLQDRRALLIHGALILATVATFAASGVNNAHRWLHLGRFNVQPSELLKLGLVLALASCFSVLSRARDRSAISRCLRGSSPAR